MAKKPIEVIKWNTKKKYQMKQGNHINMYLTCKCTKHFSYKAEIFILDKNARPSYISIGDAL